jgi:hypothetical protein
VVAYQLAASGILTVWVPCLRYNPDAPGHGKDKPGTPSCRAGK